VTAGTGTLCGGRDDRQRLRTPAQGGLREWEADVGFGVPTRVFNAVSLEDPQEVISIGFVAVSPAELAEGLAAVTDSEHVRHDRIDTVIESTTLRAMYHVRAEHDFTAAPRHIDMTGAESLLSGLR
jgi:hypothetical protein